MIGHLKIARHGRFGHFQLLTCVFGPNFWLEYMVGKYLDCSTRNSRCVSLDKSIGSNLKFNCRKYEDLDSECLHSCGRIQISNINNY